MGVDEHRETKALVVDSLVPVLFVGDMVLSGAVVEAEDVDSVAAFTVVEADVNSVASFTVVVGVGVGAEVVHSIPAALELGAT